MRDDLDALAERLGEAGTHTFGYVRVSSSKQEQGLSLESQKEKIQEFCSQHALGEPLIITEVGSAGRRMLALPFLKEEGESEEVDSRPRLHLLLGHLSSCKKTRLVVWRLDRLARINAEREMLYHLLQRFDCQLHTTDAREQILLENPKDPMIILMRNVLGSFSEYEKAVIEMRMMAGLRYKAAKGGFTGGKHPYGYDLVDSELVVNKEARANVRYIYMLRYKYGYTIRHIAEVLGKFHRSTIHRILKAEGIYRGIYTDRFGQKHERPDLKILDDDEDYHYEQEFTRDNNQ